MTLLTQQVVNANMTTSIYRHLQGKRIQGIALIEVLISVLLLSLGIIALVGLQAAMNKNTTQTKLRGEASFLANQLIGQMWVDQTNLSEYKTTETGCQDTNATNCTKWYALVQRNLPKGSAVVKVVGNEVNIVINWQLPSETKSQYQIDALVID